MTVSVFITALYTFRMLFMAFHGEERFRHAGSRSCGAGSGTRLGHDGHGGEPRESPWVVTVPLVLLAIPSIYSGWAYIDPVLFGNYFGALDPDRSAAHGHRDADRGMARPLGIRRARR